MAGLALSMMLGAFYYIMKNESQVEAYKNIEAEIQARKTGRLLPQRRPKPSRSLMDTLFFIFGQDHLNLKILVPINVRPPLTDAIVKKAT